MSKAEELAEQGKVEECKELYVRAEQLKQQKASASANSLLNTFLPNELLPPPVNIPGITLLPGTRTYVDL